MDRGQQIPDTVILVEEEAFRDLESLLLNQYDGPISCRREKGA